MWFENTNNFLSGRDLMYRASSRWGKLAFLPYKPLLLLEMLTEPLAWRAAQCHRNEMSVLAYGWDSLCTAGPCSLYHNLLQ